MRRVHGSEVSNATVQVSGLSNIQSSGVRQVTNRMRLLSSQLFPSIVPGSQAAQCKHCTVQPPTQGMQQELNENGMAERAYKCRATCIAIHSQANLFVPFSTDACPGCLELQTAHCIALLCPAPGDRPLTMWTVPVKNDDIIFGVVDWRFGIYDGSFYCVCCLDKGGLKHRSAKRQLKNIKCLPTDPLHLIRVSAPRTVLNHMCWAYPMAMYQ